MEDKIKRLLKYAATWQTDMGGWLPGEDVILRGKSLMSELDRHPWMGVLLYAITGKIATEKQIRLYEGIWVISTSFPEPRIWSNHIASLACNVRSTPALGISAGLAINEATVYGHRPIIAVANFLENSYQKMQSGQSLYDILKKIVKTKTQGKPAKGMYREPSKIPGFGRPVTRKDERLEPMMRLAKDLDIDNGPMVKLVFDIEKTLNEMRLKLDKNISVLATALVLDQGMTPREFYYFMIVGFSIGIVACANDSENHPEGSFFPMPCETIDYRGPNKMKWQTTK